MDGVRIIHTYILSFQQSETVVLLRWKGGKLWFITGLVDGLISTEGEATHLAKSWLEGLLNKLVTKREKGARATAMTTAERTCISHKEKEKFCTLCTFRSCSRPINDVE